MQMHTNWMKQETQRHGKRIININPIWFTVDSTLTPSLPWLLPAWWMCSRWTTIEAINQKTNIHLWPTYLLFRGKRRRPASPEGHRLLGQMEHYSLWLAGWLAASLCIVLCYSPSNISPSRLQTGKLSILKEPFCGCQSFIGFSWHSYLSSSYFPLGWSNKID